MSIGSPSQIRAISVGALALRCIGVAGCVTVDPRPDFDRAERMAVERTGVDRVYRSEPPSIVEDAVETLLADGLTTDEAVQIALLANQRFQALFQEIGVSRAELVQSGLLSNPSLGLSSRFPEGGGRSNLTVTFAQQWVDLWQIPVRKRIASAALERSILSIVHDANNLAADVKQDCYRLIALKRLETIAAESLELAEKSLKLAGDRFDAGEVGRVDVNLARSNVLSRRSRAMAVHRDARVARTALAHTLGLARWRRAWILDDSLPQDNLPVMADESLLLFAMSERLDARAAAMKVQAADDEIERQYLNVFPNVTLGVELERQERRSLPGRNILADTARASVAGGRLTAPSIQSRSQRKSERRQIIDALLGPTLDITLPIWDQNQAQIAKARFRAVQARKEYEAILDQVAREIHEARIVAVSASELVRFYEQDALPHARKSVDVAERAYRAGSLDILALLDTQKTLVAQREAYTAAQRDRAIAMADIPRATGGRLPPDTDDGARANQTPRSNEKTP